MSDNKYNQMSDASFKLEVAKRLYPDVPDEKWQSSEVSCTAFSEMVIDGKLKVSRFSMSCDEVMDIAIKHEISSIAYPGQDRYAQHKLSGVSSVHPDHKRAICEVFLVLMDSN